MGDEAKEILSRSLVHQISQLQDERDTLRDRAWQLSEAVWAMMKYMGDDEDRDDILAPNEWLELTRLVRNALARIDFALNKAGRK